MIRLAEKYGHNPAEEFPMLFQRILQNAIRDFYRRTKVRSRWTSLFSSMISDDVDAQDFLETLDLSKEDIAPPNPEQIYTQNQLIAIIEQELEKLPARQREAFVLRYWLDMDVSETAASMGCSDGSVKTHCSRATHTLSSALKRMGISP